MKRKIEVINSNLKFKVNKKNIADAAEKILRAEGAQLYSLSILVCEDTYIQNMHKIYFDDDSPTDVISFPMDKFEKDNPEGGYLGDLLISADRAFKVAKDFDNTLQKEFFLYVVHGILHLLGYDDIAEADRLIMREKEKKILKSFSFRNKQEIIYEL